MHILIIKTSSLGDVIHALPALTDVLSQHPDLKCDWVVEEAFAEIPTWHRASPKIIPSAIRRWKKSPLKALSSGEIRKFLQDLRATKYDYIIDAQGLFLKSAIISSLARGKSFGYDWQSIREPLASLCYDQKIKVAKNQHAITRIRTLFASVFQYPVPIDVPNYGLKLVPDTQIIKQEKNIIFIHGTSRIDKCWPVERWIELGKMVNSAGLCVQMPWGNATEKSRAEYIAKNLDNAQVLPKLNLTALSKIFLQADAAVAVDTGLGHLAAALSLPCVSLYGNTDPNLIGAWGEKQIHLTATTISDKNQAAPLSDINATQVWQALQMIRQ